MSYMINEASSTGRGKLLRSVIVSGVKSTTSVVVVTGLVLQMSVATQASAGTSPECVYADTSYFNSLTGVSPAVELQFIADQPDSRGGWANYDGSAWYAASVIPSSIKASIGVPLYPAIPGVSMAAAAAGNYNSHYVNAAKQLKAYGHGDAYIRPGWEFNGNWYAWGYNYPGQNKSTYCSNYNVAFQNVVKAFRSVSPSFKFIWNPNLSDQYTMPNIGACYPGDSYVDYIGLDVYDFNYNNISDPVQRFQTNVLDRQFGLLWQQGVGQRHNKPLAYPEWGVGAAGDNPYMIQAMGSWFSSTNTTLQCYWNGGSSSGYDGNLQDHPQEASMFHSEFYHP